MKAFIARTLSGVDSLAVHDMPAPGPLAPGQIRVAMRAASINYRDLLVLSGALRSVTVSELIPCSDVAGEVVEVASEVWRVKVGDRVALTFIRDWIGGQSTRSRGPAEASELRGRCSAALCWSDSLARAVCRRATAAWHECAAARRRG